MKKIVVGLLLVCPLFSFGQYDNGFPFGKITYAELDMKNYSKDTSANAIVLNEFGEAYIDSDGENNLVLEYHIKIKILKKISAFRYKNKMYSFPYEIKAIQKIWKYRQPEIEGF